MPESNRSSKGVDRLNSRARSLLETYEMTKTYSVRWGEVQQMVYHKDLGKLGGLSTKPRGQYILAFKAHGLIKGSRMRELGFHIRYRSGGTPYWYRAGHSDFRGFTTAVSEMSGVGARPMSEAS